MLGLALLAVEYLRLTGGVEKLANTTSSESCMKLIPLKKKQYSFIIGIK